MPLIQCPKCKRDIASTCVKCSYCGYQLKSIIIDEEDENNAHYLLIGSRILLVVLIAVVGTLLFLPFKRSSKPSMGTSTLIIEQELIPSKTESVTINLANPDTLFAKAKSLYRRGKYNDADVVLTQIISNYKNSNIAIEASKLKVIVVKKIQDKWNAEQKKGEKELQQIYENDPIRYYKNIYGAPDSEDDFSFESYRTKTLTWHCVAGKYRSITFELKDGTWRKQSQYTSNCL